MLDRLQEILKSAVLRQPAVGGELLLPALVVEELAGAFGLASAGLWLIAGTSFEQISQVPGGRSSAETDPALRARLVNAAELPGELLQEEIPTAGLQCQTIAALVASGLTLVLELEGSAIPFGLTESAVEILADLYRRGRLDVCQRFRESIDRFDLFLPGLYGAGSAAELSAVLASDLPAVLGCTRVCVCVREGSGWRMESATGPGGVNERAEAVLKTCRAVAEQSRQQRGGVAEVCEVGRRWILPLDASGCWADSSRALVLEFANGDLIDEEFSQRVVRHVRVALRNHGVTGGARGRSRGSLGIRRRLWVVVGAAVVAAGVLCLWPAELRISASGRLLPRQRLRMYAPESGLVTAVAVRDGSQVIPGQPLIQLRSDELLIELEDVLGQLAAAEARIAAIEQLKALRSADPGVLAAEQAEISAGMDSLIVRRRLLEDRISSLEVRAEFAGRVYADDAAERMMGRPLQRGQFLFEVADPAGSWELHLEVPERETRYVLAAMSVSPPVVEFFSESAPELVQTGRLSRISESAEVNDAGQLIMRVRADLDGSTRNAESERPGAGVRAEISCGHRSLGYVLFRRFIEFVQRGGR